MVPEMRCERTALIFDMPPRAAKTLETISSAVWDVAVRGKNKIVAKQRGLIFMIAFTKPLADWLPELMVRAVWAEVNLDARFRKGTLYSGDDVAVTLNIPVSHMRCIEGPTGISVAIQ